MSGLSRRANGMDPAGPERREAVAWTGSYIPPEGRRGWPGVPRPLRAGDHEWAAPELGLDAG
jgi:hypothetical protein